MKGSAHKKTVGFSLVELMVAIAIIGVLAAVSFSSYSGFITKSQVAAGFAEISAAKVIVENKINEGISEAITNPSLVGLLGDASERCAYSVAVNMNGESKLSCLLKGNRQVSGKTIQWMRSADESSGANGTWTCQTNVIADSQPKSCEIKNLQ